MALRAPLDVPFAKIIAFEYFLVCFLKKLGLNVENQTVTEINDELSKHGWVYINKLLYFTVLQSSIEGQLEGTTSPSKTSLLEIFDKFTAYPKGDVEADIYENRAYGIFFAFKVNDKNKLVLRDRDLDKRIKFIMESIDLGTDYRRLIKESVDKVYNWSRGLSTDDLVAKSHILPFWRKAFQVSVENNKGAITVGDISEIWETASEEEKKAELEAYKEQSYQSSIGG